MPAIRNQIRELRAQLDMTQQDLADRVGVTRQTVIAIEQDKYSPSLETAFKGSDGAGCANRRMLPLHAPRQAVGGRVFKCREQQP